MLVNGELDTWSACITAHTFRAQLPTVGIHDGALYIDPCTYLFAMEHGVSFFILIVVMDNTSTFAPETNPTQQLMQHIFVLSADMPQNA